MDFFDALEAAARSPITKKPWMADCVMTLVTEATLPAVIDECIAAGEYALDLETEGLDNRVYNGRTINRIVGVCLSPDGVRGYYVPVLHLNHRDKCVSSIVVHAELSRLTSSNSIAIFHNGKFDQEFLQFNGWGGPLGEWDKPGSWEDTLILAYLRNTRERNKGLKHLSKTELDMEMIELDELFTPEELKQYGKNFSILDPSREPVLWYACSDAICTYRLKKALYDAAVLPRDGMPSQLPLYRIEKLCVASTRWMERLRIPIDREKVTELIRVGQQEWFPALKAVYEEASKALGRDITPGYFRILEADPHLSFDVNVVFPSIQDRVDTARTASEQRKVDPVEMDGKGGLRIRTITKRVPGLVNKKVAEDIAFPLVYDVLKPENLGLLLRELGVGGLKATEKSGQIKTSADELDRVVEDAGEDFPFIGKVKRFREVAKAIASNLMPLFEYTAQEKSPDGRIKVNFEAFKVDTGRFSTPGREGKAGFTGTIPWNLQSVPAGYDPRRPECSTRLRECIRALPGRLLFAIDYSGEELRVVTNLSGEPLWVTEFFRCSGCDHQFDRGATIPPPPEPPPPFCPKCGSDKIGDLHTLTALAVYGEGIKADKEMFKQRRKEAKCVHPDTMLRTENGLLRIGTLPVGSEDTFCVVQDVRVAGPNQTLVPVVETYNGGVKELFHVLTRRGVLTCSAEHRFQMADGSLQSIVTGLSEGATLSDPEVFEDSERSYPVLTYRPFAGVPLVQVPTNAQTAYVAGLHAGDGASSTTSAHIVHGSIEKTDPLGVPYTEWQKILIQACREAGLEPIPRTTGIYLGSRQVLRWMGVLGMVQGSRRTFRVPDWIWQAGREALRHYLGGLIDTDGSVSKGGDINLVTKDMIFAGQIAEAFRAAGCRPSVAPSYNKTYDRWYVKISIKRCEGRILRPYMRHPGKIERLSETETEYSAWGNDVLKIIPAGKHTCVDLHVDSESHLYVGNGLTIHNSVNFGLCYGGGGLAVQRATGCAKEEGWRIKRQYDRTYGTLFAWWKTQHEYARKTKHVLTAFNRRYPLPDIDSSDDGFRAKAERNAVNGPVQGCLHPDARVVTRTGIRTVKDLWDEANSGGPVRFHVWTGKGWSEARPLLSGSKPHVTTVFEDGGRIDTSPEHLFRTWRDGAFQWVRQSDLRDGDWVARDAHAVDFPEPRYVFEDKGNTHNATGFTFDGNSSVLWELLGRVIGDGSIRDDGFIVHIGEAPHALDTEVKECGYSAESHARAFAERVALGIGLKVVVKEKKRQAGDTRRNTWTVSICNTAFVNFCRTVLGLRSGNTLNKAFPTAVWRESLSNRAAFLRGYFDADGTVSRRSDAVSVRSANVGLLRETYALLRSVGVRASLRETSQRVSVLDREAFRDVIGSGVEYKAARLRSVSRNPHTGRNTHFPTDIMASVGKCIYQSHGYATLPRAMKSAVLRLRSGSGSKAQCTTLSEAVGIPLPDEFVYNYDRVVGKVDHGTHVDMYDVEVLDDDHAFACDGVIVHNTGADIMKFAMGLIYIECKRRGWLDRVRMIITIHDELVFEIDEDLVAESLPVIKYIMLRKVTEKMPWRVPLTCDIEAGNDWTVPWNITEMEYGKKKTAPEIAHVVAALVAAREGGGAQPLPALSGAAPVVQPPPHPTTPTEAVQPPPASPQPPQPPPASPQPPPQSFAMPTVGAGEVYVHIVRSAALSVKLASRIATVIAECRGRGVNPLRIADETGKVLWYDPNVRVNPIEFAVLVNRRGD